MYQRYLGFLLLVWLPAVLRAQPAAQRCHAPLLSGGFFVPGNEFFSHGAKVTYSCNDGRKPVSGGWWATSTCQDGQWSDRPQCIDENACLKPTVPNANYAQNARTWYANGYILRMKCNEGYKFLNNDATAKCSNGMWTSLPACQRDEYSCGEPPQVPHAVIIDQEYRELFAMDSQVTYQCEDGYTSQEGSNKMSIVCHYGNWTTPSSCTNTPHGEEEEPTQTHEGDDANPFMESVNPGSSESVGNGNKPMFANIRNCGTYPPIEHGEVVGKKSMYLKYQCSGYYSLEGPDTVHCFSNGQWSELPVCRATYCHVITEDYPDLADDGHKYVRDGEDVKLNCVRKSHWVTQNYAVGRCRNTIITFAGCCSSLTPINLCRGHITYRPMFG